MYMKKEKSEILFFGIFPSEENLRDGMFQRMHAIDQQFLERKRTYLHISMFSNCKKIFNNDVEYLTIIRSNFFLHFFFNLLIIKKIRVYYFHSIYTVKTAIPYLCLINSPKKVILDVHGVVPEELALLKKRFLSFIFSFCEKYILKRTTICIVVTTALQRHLTKKYTNISCKFVLYPILPSHLEPISLIPATETEERLTVIYSGNAQPWQNLDLMCKIISDNIASKVCYIILTGQLETVKEILKNKNLSGNPNLHVETVKPNKLNYYYNKAHYGFILRDDIIVNNVACPTKMIEYMNAGIIPIVLTPNIGDFKALGYEYIKYTDYSANLPVRKSEKNVRIVSNIIENLSTIKLEEII